MNQDFSNLTSRVFIITFLGAFLSAQQLDSQDIYNDDSQNVYHLITNKSYFYVEN